MESDQTKQGLKIKEADFTYIIQNLGGPAEIRKFYTHLELPDAEIEKAIYGADTNDIELQARAVLRLWIRRKGRNATKEWVIRALINSENENAAQGLQDHWKKDLQSSTNTSNQSGPSKPIDDNVLVSDSEPSPKRQKIMDLQSSTNTSNQSGPSKPIDDNVLVSDSEPSPKRQKIMDLQSSTNTSNQSGPSKPIDDNVLVSDSEPSPKRQKIMDLQSSTNTSNQSGPSKPIDDNVLVSDSEPSPKRQKIMGREKQPSPEDFSSRGETEISGLYEDQLEVTRQAIEGKNTMIQMPTGAGKTVVAAYVIKKVINKAGDPMKYKAIFIVPTQPLVKQQQGILEQLLQPSTNFRITGLHGDNQTIPLKNTLEVYNVVVLTAAILDNALKDKNSPIDIHTLSLLVFDECHHCMKDHVYNSIMKRYHYEKFEHPHICDLPQIVAMTATTGTGKAKSQLAADDHVFQLICNLNTPYISVVEQNKNKLQGRLHVPQEMNLIDVEPRAKDPFKDEVWNIMISIEKMMTNSEAGSLLTELKDIPSDKKSQVYMQWLSKLETESGKHLKDGELLRTYYHESLLINAEVRTKDANEYLNSKYDEMSNLHQMESFNKTDHDLLKMFTGKCKAFEEFSKNSEYDNPLLIKLKDIIVREYDRRPESRALLFCRTVETTIALKTWMEETDSLRFLQPERIVGGKGMTTAEHKKILDKFKGGRHKLLVTTNVLEEGIDVAECNLVIRLNYIPSDTGHVQSKGRGRAKGSKCYLIASSENAAALELANQARSEMSIRAIYNFRGMPEEELIAQMLTRQKEDYSQFKTEKETPQPVVPKHSGEFQLFCGGCRHFACSTVDIGVYNEAHHIVLDQQFLVERTKIRPHPKPQNIDNEISKCGKIYCKKCNHDWGILADICKRKLPIIKIVSFIIEKEQGNGKPLTYLAKKWIDAKKIFHVKPFKLEDLDKMKKMNVPDY